jgi:Zn-dependent protease
LIYQLLTGQMGYAEFVALLIALVFGISVHEFAHALAATWLGDPLPGKQGRLTLQPAAHLDLMGSLMFLVGGFGWGKPVQYNPYALRTSPRVGPALVAVAGPLSNFILAILIGIIARLMPLFFGTTLAGLMRSGGPEGVLFNLLIGIAYYNLILSFFNLIPIPPLDGFTILEGILPLELAERLQVVRQYGFLILIVLLIAGGGILGQILYQPVLTVLRLLIGARF